MAYSTTFITTTNNYFSTVSFSPICTLPKQSRATEFSGTTKPEEAKKWLRTLEKCFCVMQCWEAEDRWILEESRREMVNWEEFKKIFNNKYFHVMYIEEKSVGFFYLEQRELS